MGLNFILKHTITIWFSPSSYWRFHLPSPLDLSHPPHNPTLILVGLSFLDLEHGYHCLKFLSFHFSSQCCTVQLLFVYNLLLIVNMWYIYSFLISKWHKLLSFPNAQSLSHTHTHCHTYINRY